MEAALLIDIGSTFTKACSIDLLEERILASVCTPSTTNTNGNVQIKRSLIDKNIFS